MYCAAIFACAGYCRGESGRLQEDGHLQGAPDWLIERRSPDQSTLDLQNKSLHCLGQGTRLAWLIDIQREQVWV